MKKIMRLVILLTIWNCGYSQDELMVVPQGIIAHLPDSVRSTITPQWIEKGFKALLGETDTLWGHQQRVAQRWMTYEYPNYDYKGNGFTLKNYLEATRSSYLQGLDCKTGPNQRWEYVGPNTGNTQLNGRPDAVYNYKNDPNIMLAGSYSSGIMKSIDGGVHWTCVTDQLPFPVMGIAQFMAHPQTPEKIFAVCKLEFVPGALIYSPDLGETWQEVHHGLPQFQWIDYHNFFTGVIFAVSAKQIHYSMNYGQTWETLNVNLNLDDAAWLKEIVVTDQALYVNTYQPNNTYKSSIIQVQYSFQGQIPVVNAVNNITSTLHPNGYDATFFSNKVNQQFIFTGTFNTANFGVAEGQNWMFNGLNWSLLPASTNIEFLSNTDKFEILLSPNNPNQTYYTAALHSVRKADIASATAQLLFDLGGEHADYRSSMIINDQGKDRMIFGNDGGVALVKNGLDNDPNQAGVLSVNGDIQISLLHAMDVHEKTGRLLYAFQDHNGMILEDENNTNHSFPIGEGSSALIQPFYPDNFLGDSGMGGGLREGTINFNTSRSIIITPFAASQCFLGGTFVKYREHPDRFARGLNALEVGDINNRIAQNLGVKQSVYRKINTSDAIGALAICERKPDVMYAADFNWASSGERRLFKSTDNGVNWLCLTEAVAVGGASTVSLDEGNTQTTLWFQLQSNRINAIAVDHDNPDLLYCGIGGTHTTNDVITNERFRVIRSFDGGKTFTDYSEGLPALPIDRLLTIDADNDLIFCANNIGVYYRTADMDRWECFSRDLPDVRITRLQFDYCNKELYASTYGRGLWKTPVNFQLVHSGHTEITSQVVWNEDRIVTEDILIKPGGILTLTAEFHFLSDIKIDVEPGGQLIIDGATLSTHCNSYWEGINVWGNFFKPQTQAEQGFCEIKNNSVIENAKEAVRLWNPGDYATTGGIIQASNSTFRNNRRSAEFIYYHNGSGSTEILNKSSFTKCLFEWTPKYSYPNNAPAITMYHVNGVRIKGCTFWDKGPFRYGSAAINSIDAGFTVDAISLIQPGGSSSDEDWFQTKEYIPTVIRQLETGIRAGNVTAATSVVIDHTSFLVNTYGILCDAIDNVAISRNSFDRTLVGIKLDACTGYFVEGNTFVQADWGLLNHPPIYTTGIEVVNSGTEANRIYRNRHNLHYYANWAIGNNANDEFQINKSTGLEWHCQYNTDNFMDFTVSKGFPYLNEQGVRLLQGQPGQSTGNTFTAGTASPWSLYDRHLVTDDQQTMNYFAYDNDQRQIPTEIDGDVLVNLISVENGCESTFPPIVGLPVQGGGIGRLTSDLRRHLAEELQQIGEGIGERNHLLTQHLEGGNRPELHLLISSLNKTNRLQIREALMAESPWLSEELLHRLGEQPAALFPHEWYKELVLQNLEVARDKNFRAFLRHKPNPLPNGMVLEIESKSSSGFTERGLLEIELLEYKSRREQLLNRLLRDAWATPDTIPWPQIDSLSALRGHQMDQNRQLKRLLAQNRQQEAAALLSALEQEAQLWPEGFNKTEAEGLVQLKQLVLNLLEADGSIRKLEAAEINQLEQMALNGTGKAGREARLLLCFFADQCDGPYLPQAPALKGQNKSLNPQVGTSPENLEIRPNPGNGNFELILPENTDTQSLRIVNTQGIEQKFILTGNLSAVVHVQLEQPVPGVYLLELRNTEGISFLTRFVVME